MSRHIPRTLSTLVEFAVGKSQRWILHKIWAILTYVLKVHCNGLFDAHLRLTCRLKMSFTVWTFSRSRWNRMTRQSLFKSYVCIFDPSLFTVTGWRTGGGGHLLQCKLFQSCSKSCLHEESPDAARETCKHQETTKMKCTIFTPGQIPFYRREE